MAIDTNDPGYRAEFDNFIVALSGAITEAEERSGVDRREWLVTAAGFLGADLVMHCDTQPEAVGELVEELFAGVAFGREQVAKKGG